MKYIVYVTLYSTINNILSLRIIDLALFINITLFHRLMYSILYLTFYAIWVWLNVTFILFIYLINLFIISFIIIDI
jgi:hypothetical protein